MKKFKTYAKEWEKNAQQDAYWSVLTSSQYEKKEWNKEEFFQTGKNEIRRLKDYVEKMQLPIPFQGAVLDFGCGVGRLTQALAEYFHTVYGLDISKNMIDQAKKTLSSNLSHIHFVHHSHPHLQLFPSNQFDFIYSNIVLQHIAKRHQLHYLSEFARITKPGGWIIVQIPSEKVYSHRLKKAVGYIISILPYSIRKLVHRHLLRNKTRAIKEFDFEINVSHERSIEKIASKTGLEIKHIAYTNSCEADFGGNLVFQHSRQAIGSNYISPMYFMQKK